MSLLRLHNLQALDYSWRIDQIDLTESGHTVMIVHMHVKHGLPMRERMLHCPADRRTRDPRSNLRILKVVSVIDRPVASNEDDTGQVSGCFGHAMGERNAFIGKRVGYA
ncbi:MAG: hypothetical protein ABL982_19190 [Vicinamibacterales bacterium]